MADEPDFATLAAAVRPRVNAAIAAEAARDDNAVCAALHMLYAMDAVEVFFGTCLLGELAALRIKPEGSDQEYMPLFVDARTGGRFDPDEPKNAARGFVGRFVVASVNRDLELRKALWAALIEPACEPDPDPVAERIVHEAGHLLVAAATAGLAREASAVRAREHRKHQHPKARSRAGHKPHRRDQHRR